MFPTIDPGDISKRVLSPEAVRALCEIYPSGKPATCAPPTGSGCAIAADSRSDSVLVLVIGLVLVAVAVLVPRFRRRQRRAPTVISVAAAPLPPFTARASSRT